MMKSKNLTVTLKPNNKKSTTNPVYVRVGGVVKKIKLSKEFKNAGTIYNRNVKGKKVKDKDMFIIQKKVIK